MTDSQIMKPIRIACFVALVVILILGNAGLVKGQAILSEKAGHGIDEVSRNSNSVVSLSGIPISYIQI